MFSERDPESKRAADAISRGREISCRPGSNECGLGLVAETRAPHLSDAQGRVNQTPR